MKFLTTVFTSAALVVGAQAFAASDHASTGATQGSNAATHSKALQTPSRDLTRDRNPNAATPATPYPGEGKAATPAIPSSRSTTDTDDTTTSTTGTGTGSVSGSTDTTTSTTGTGSVPGSTGTTASGSLSGSTDTSISASPTTSKPLTQEQRDLLRSQRSGGMSPTTK